MRKTYFLLAVICLLSCARKYEEKSVNLNIPWKFTTGDNMEYASPSFPDNEWKTIGSDRIWESYGYDPYDGFAWYRIRIAIPSSLKETAFLKDSLKFFLGKINNFDQTFLNGQIIGINGRNVPSTTLIDTSFLQAPASYWDLERKYTLAVNDPRILWDQENVIAVRVYDEGGQGGLYTGNQFISMTSVSDYLKIDALAEPFSIKDGKLGKSMRITNLSKDYSLPGTLKITATNKLSGENLFTKAESLVMQPGETKTYPVILDPLDQSIVVQYSFRHKGAGTLSVQTEESPYICTPLPPATPRINGPGVTAARPGRPFLYTIPVSGDRPIHYAADNLPKGLRLDPALGIISGTVATPGEYLVSLKADNIQGSGRRDLKIVIGDQIALTPPMGWNSWNCWGLTVDEKKVLASAQTYIRKGLADHGWIYINIDDGWEIRGDLEPKRDAKGNILVNEKFPDMKALGDNLHSMGLKFGIYSSPGPLTCGGYTASYQHEEQDARSFASWGVDYLKYDWCSYDNIARDTSLAERKKPYLVMKAAMAKINRDIVYSLCQYGMSKVWEWGASVGGNLWRTTGDITDSWESMSGIGFSQVENAPYAGPGHWNDPDMLVVGWVGWGPSLHPSHLTPDEQYTHISLWCLLSAPLLIGCDLERLDEFTLNLLTNDEVLAIDQDPLGKQAVPMIKTGSIQVWVKQLADGTKAVGIFNLGTSTENYTLNFSEAGLELTQKLRDLWRQKDLGEYSGAYQADIPSHGVLLIKTW